MIELKLDLYTLFKIYIYLIDTWRRKIKASYYCRSRTPNKLKGGGDIALLEHTCLYVFSAFITPPPPPLKIPRSTSESYLYVRVYTGRDNFIVINQV